MLPVFTPPQIALHRDGYRVFTRTCVEQNPQFFWCVTPYEVRARDLGWARLQLTAELDCLVRVLDFDSYAGDLLSVAILDVGAVGGHGLALRWK